MSHYHDHDDSDYHDDAEEDADDNDDDADNESCEDEEKESAKGSWQNIMIMIHDNGHTGFDDANNVFNNHTPGSL